MNLTSNLLFIWLFFFSPLLCGSPGGLQEGLMANIGITGVSTPASIFYNPALLTGLDFKNREALSSGQTIISRNELSASENSLQFRNADINFDSLFLAQAERLYDRQIVFALVKTPVTKLIFDYKFFDQQNIVQIDGSGQSNSQQLSGLVSYDFLNEPADKPLHLGMTLGMIRQESDFNFYYRGKINNQPYFSTNEKKAVEYKALALLGLNWKPNTLFSLGSIVSFTTHSLFREGKQRVNSSVNGATTEDSVKDVDTYSTNHLRLAVGGAVNLDTTTIFLETQYTPPYKEKENGIEKSKSRAAEFALGFSKQLRDRLDLYTGYRLRDVGSESRSDFVSFGFLRKYNTVDFVGGLFYDSNDYNQEDGTKSIYKQYGFNFGSTIFY